MKCILDRLKTESAFYELVPTESVLPAPIGAPRERHRLTSCAQCTTLTRTTPAHSSIYLALARRLLFSTFATRSAERRLRPSLPNNSCAWRMRHALCCIEDLHRTRHTRAATTPHARRRTRGTETLTALVYNSKSHTNAAIRLPAAVRACGGAYVALAPRVHAHLSAEHVRRVDTKRAHGRKYGSPCLAWTRVD